MPNWCNNSITLRHKDSAMVQRAQEALAAGRLLQEFIPCPQDLIDTVSGFMGEDKRAAHEAQMARNIELYGYKDWYDWNVANWGTKWDVGGDDSYCERDGNTLQLGFDSAWSPPTAAYNVLEELGFTVKATYWEPGMAFCGIYEDGDDDYYEYGNMSADEIEDFLPAELLDLGIADDVRSWQDEQDELREDDEGDE